MQAYNDRSLAMMAETTAFVRRLKEFETQTPGAARFVIDSLCAAFDLQLSDTGTFVAATTSASNHVEHTGGIEPSSDRDGSPMGSLYIFPAGQSPLSGVARKAPSRGEFEYIILAFLLNRGVQGATRQEMVDLFDRLGFAVGKPSAFATRLNLTLKGGATETIGFVTWNANQKNPSATVTKAGRARFVQLEQGKPGSPLPLTEREQLRPRLTALLNSAEGGNDAS